MGAYAHGRGIGADKEVRISLTYGEISEVFAGSVPMKAFKSWRFSLASILMLVAV